MDTNPFEENAGDSGSELDDEVWAPAPPGSASASGEPGAHAPFEVPTDPTPVVAEPPSGDSPPAPETPPPGAALPPYAAVPPYGPAAPYPSTPPHEPPPYATAPFAPPTYPPPYGTGAYAGPGAPADGGTTSPGGPQPAARTRWRRVAAGAVVALLVAGAAAAGVVIGRSSSPNSGETTSAGMTGLQKIPQPVSSKGATNAKLNVAGIARKIDPATVDITSILSLQGAEAEGTGIVLTSNGEVLTNNHVIAGATSITAQVDGTGRKYQVKVLGADPVHDVALLLLEGASNLPHVTIGNSNAVAVGDPVVAIGNALGLGGTPTVTSGIVSALGRSITAQDAGSGATEHLTGMIQTDAPINPGNSGGPLVNAAGQVIGMNTAAITGNGTQSASDIGFAIPIDRAIRIATDIEEHRAVGSIVLGTHGIMGVDVETVAEAETLSGGSFSPPVSYGAVVYQVLAGSPAAQAGLTSGDVIVAFDGRRVLTIEALGDLVKATQPGQRASVTWIGASGARHTATLILAQAPAV
jgi:S1-C subfamily serine protease